MSADHDPLCPVVPMRRADGSVAFYGGVCACDFITDIRDDQDKKSRADERQKARQRVEYAGRHMAVAVVEPLADAAGGDA